MKTNLHAYLRGAREALVWKLDGLSEYDARRPLTPTGLNLLGLVKHVASVDVGYFGECFGRPFGEPLPWFDDDAEPNADFWVPADVTRADVLGLAERAWAHSDATIEALPLDAVGHVAWWGDGGADVTLHRPLVHMATETHRHAGQADILRETIDGAVGLLRQAPNLPDVDAEWWPAYVARVEGAARAAAG
ncbi:MAG: DinB family protein [Actinomycetales bacterium]|nr:DinB family protein [Actinomycetales bacterium]